MKNAQPTELSIIEGTIRYYTTGKIGLGEKILVTLLLLAYVFLPIDLIPDLIPVIGWLDDIGVSCLALAYFNYCVSKVDSSTNDEKRDDSFEKMQEPNLIENEETHGQSEVSNTDFKKNKEL